MKKWTLLAGMIAFGGLAHAKTPAPPSFDLSNFAQSRIFYIRALAAQDKAGMPPVPKVCADVKATDDQMTKIRDAVYQFESSQAQLEANVKIAFLAYGRTVADPSSDLSAAQAAEANALAAVSKLVGNALDLKNNILYSILTTDQRQPAVACLSEVEKELINKKLDKICSGRAVAPTPSPTPTPTPAPLPIPSPSPTPIG